MKVIIHWRNGGSRPITEITNVGGYKYRPNLLRLWSEDRSTVRDIFLRDDTVESVTFTDLTDGEFSGFHWSRQND